VPKNRVQTVAAQWIAGFLRLLTHDNDSGVIIVTSDKTPMYSVSVLKRESGVLLDVETADSKHGNRGNRGRTRRRG